MIADKRKASTSILTNNIRALICFSLLRSTIKCLRGSRSVRYLHTKDIDIKVNALIKNDQMKTYDIKIYISILAREERTRIMDLIVTLFLDL